MKLLNFLPLLTLLTVGLPAVLAQTIVTSPTNGEQVSSPFNLTMSATPCSSNPVSAVGYSLDNSSNTSSWPTQNMKGRLLLRTVGTSCI
jgi:hypothetical protein